MIHWPALIVYDGEDELTYVKNRSFWDDAPDLHLFSYELDDILIDTKGLVYTLNTIVNNIVIPQVTDKIIPLDDLIELVRKHASIENYCCSAKITAQSYLQAIEIVASINEI
ncbi:MAG: hypothetical protein ACI86X_001855 [Moritella sp.]